MLYFLDTLKIFRLVFADVSMQGFPFDFPSISICQLYSNEF
jgi:hypothetical protein